MYISNLKTRRCFLIMDKITTHSLEHVGSGETLVFILTVEQYYYCLHTTKCYKCGVASFKVQYGNKL